jgi:hypothetical protein
MERRSPHSKYGRVHLDLFTTPQALTAAGRQALQGLTERFALTGARITAHDACWDRVPLWQLELLARAVLRTVNKPGNYQLDLPLATAIPNRGPATVLPFPERATA